MLINQYYYSAGVKNLKILWTSTPIILLVQLPNNTGHSRKYNLALSGVKKSLVLEPGTSKISGRTSIYFHPMSSRQVKNSVQVYLKIYFGQVIWQQDN